MKLMALMFCPFGFTTSAFVFSGVLEPMAGAFGVSVATTATLQSSFAIACALCGPVLAHFARALPPRPVLIAVLVTLLPLNTLSAMAGNFDRLLLLRLMAGGGGSLAFPLATALAVAGPSPQDRPKAISAVYVDIPMALVIGVPLGSLAGNALGWPASFAVAAAICVLALVLVLAFVPGSAPTEAAAPVARAPQFARAVYAHLGVTLLASVALFTLVGLIGPIIRATTGFVGSGIAALQFLEGVSSLIGVRLGAGLILTVPGAALAMLILHHPSSLPLPKDA